MAVPISIDRELSNLDNDSMDDIISLMNVSHALSHMLGFEDPSFSVSLKVTDKDLLHFGNLKHVKRLCTQLQLELVSATGPVPYPDEAGFSIIKDHCFRMDVTSATPRVADALVECTAKTLGLTTLRLRGLRLVSQLSCLKRMENLTCLKLVDCGLTTLPETIAELPQLRNLSLKNNLLTTLPPKMAHSQVKFLSLKNNLLCSLINLPNECVAINLKNALGIMNIADNTMCMEQLFFKGSKIQRLNISHNSLSVFPHSDNVHTLMPVLKTLCMSNNNFSVIPCFSQSLLELDASYNPLRFVQPLPQGVAILDLRHTVSDSDMLNVTLAGHYPHLKILLVSVNPADVCLRAPNLELLNAVYQDFDNNNQKDLPRMPHLKALYTSHISPTLPFMCPELTFLGVSLNVKQLPLTLRACRSLQQITASPELQPHANALLELGDNNMDLDMHLEMWGSLSNTTLTLQEEGLWELVCQWSNRLISCPQFSADPRTFSIAVAKILDAIDKDVEFKHMFESQVLSNMGDCSDRGVTALNELYVGACLVQLPQDQNEGACLLLKAAVTDTLNTVISKWCSKNVTHNESTQVFLKVTQMASGVLPLLFASTHVENDEYTTEQLELPALSDIVQDVKSCAHHTWVDYLERARLVDLQDSLAHFHEELESLHERCASKDEYDNVMVKRSEFAVELCFTKFPEARSLFSISNTQNVITAK